MTQMEVLLRFYLQNIFPRFSSPLSSRFSVLFCELSKINLTKQQNLAKVRPKNEKVNQDLEKYRIYPQKILNGLENRTSIIIKEIPTAFGALNFYKLLTKFSNQIKFFYIPDFAVAKWEYIYAFVTFDHTKGVLDIYEGLTLMKEKFKTFKGYDFSKIEIYFCKYQNKTGFSKNSHKETYPKSFFICK